MNTPTPKAIEALPELPHPSFEHASFLLAFSGEGAGASVIHGWGELLHEFARSLWMDGDTSNHPAEWSAWLEQLSDPDEWSPDEGGDPYAFVSSVGEITDVSIYRLATLAATQAEQAKAESMADAFNSWCHYKWSPYKGSPNPWAVWQAAWQAAQPSPPSGRGPVGTPPPVEQESKS